MKDRDKSKDRLIEELEFLRRRVATLERSETQDTRLDEEALVSEEGVCTEAGVTPQGHEAWSRILFEHLPVGTVLIDGETGRHVDCNRAGLEKGPGSLHMQIARDVTGKDSASLGGRSILPMCLAVIAALLCVFGEGASAEDLPQKKQVLVLNARWGMLDWETRFNMGLYAGVQDDPDMLVDVIQEGLGIEYIASDDDLQEIIEYLVVVCGSGSIKPILQGPRGPSRLVRPPDRPK